MTGSIFLDTNILVYAYDTHDSKKQTTAQSLLKEGIETESIVLSSQVLGEFFVVVTRKIKNPVSAKEAQEIISLLGVLQIVDIDFSLVNRAVENHKNYGIGYWDSLIVAAAACAGCKRVLTEDLNDGQEYDNVLVENPFH
jgi:predicted nucleic acid-binding protein